jgi:serine/threonine protein kinase
MLRASLEANVEPANVLIALDGEEGDGAPARVKLADFGVSTLLAGQEDTTTEEGRPPRTRARLEDTAEPAAELAEGDTISARGGSTQDDRESQGPLTQTGILVGTPMYMAPELSEGSHLARPPSDIFSLGVIAYELYTGEIPFARPPVWARWRGSDAAAPSLAVKRPDLPAALVALIDSCLHLDPTLRPTADAIATALRHSPTIVGESAPTKAGPVGA